MLLSLCESSRFYYALSEISDWFKLSGPGLFRLSLKRGCQMGCLSLLGFFGFVVLNLVSSVRSQEIF